MRQILNLDPRLYLVTDPGLSSRRSLVDIVGEAVAGGVSLVQLRDKAAEARHLLELARALKALLDPKGVPLVVNDRADVAAAAGVGCHIGQSDLPPEAARAILGNEAILGLSLDSADQTYTADPACLDYVAHGPFATTGTKPDAGKPVGMEGIKHVRSLTALPLVAIGGLDATNAADAIRAGADGIAVISAIVAMQDPRAAARDLRDVVERSLEEAGGEREQQRASG